VRCTLQEYEDYRYFTQAILAVKVSPKLRRAQFDCELARPNGGGKLQKSNGAKVYSFVVKGGNAYPSQVVEYT
jgi:hypothetical protein